MFPRNVVLSFVALIGFPMGFAIGAGVPPQPKLSVLIVDGMNNHDWERASRILKAILLDSGRFTVDVSTSPRHAPAEQWQAWKPDFARYDVVVMNFNGGHTAQGRSLAPGSGKVAGGLRQRGRRAGRLPCRQQLLPELARLQRR